MAGLKVFFTGPRLRQIEVGEPGPERARVRTLISCPPPKSAIQDLRWASFRLGTLASWWA